MGFSAHLRSLFKALGCVARAIAVRLGHRVARRAAPLATRRARRAYALRAAPAAHKRPGRHLHRPSRSASAPRGAGCRRAPARPGRIAAGARPPPGCGKRAKVRLTRGGDPRPAPATRDAWGSGARTRGAERTGGTRTATDSFRALRDEPHRGARVRGDDEGRESSRAHGARGGSEERGIGGPKRSMVAEQQAVGRCPIPRGSKAWQALTRVFAQLRARPCRCPEHAGYSMGTSV